MDLGKMVGALECLPKGRSGLGLRSKWCGGVWRARLPKDMRWARLALGGLLVVGSACGGRAVSDEATARGEPTDSVGGAYRAGAGGSDAKGSGGPVGDGGAGGQRSHDDSEPSVKEHTIEVCLTNRGSSDLYVALFGYHCSAFAFLCEAEDEYDGRPLWAGAGYSESLGGGVGRARVQWL
jgi:hypothetical protein